MRMKFVHFFQFVGSSSPNYGHVFLKHLVEWKGLARNENGPTFPTQLAVTRSFVPGLYHMGFGALNLTRG